MRIPDDFTALIMARLELLEAEKAVRGIAMRYFDLCDRLGPQTDFAALGALFAETACWRGVGQKYASAFGNLQGRQAIVEMLASHKNHFARNAHFLTSEEIVVARDGRTAAGNWLMLQTSVYSAGHADLRSARLKLHFRREDDWRIQEFETENLFSRAISHWDDDAAIHIPKRPGS